MTYAMFSNEYGLVNSSIYNMSSNAEDEIIQMMAVNQFNQAMIQSANLAGVNPSHLAYGSALAQQNMSDSFSISGQMAGRYIPVVYGIFSALFLAFSLFLIILMALPIGVNYLKMYMELGLFLAVWPALMAVYKYIIDLIVQQQFTYLATQGYSINSAHTINTFIATQLGWMGYLSWGVPMMAYALVTGSTYAMVGAISSMDAAGKSASSAAASQAASGNVNLGNDSMSNYSAANKSIDNLNVMDISTGNIRRNNVGEGSRSFASNTATGNNLINGISGGALNDKNFKGSITNTGGEVAMSGQVSRQGLESMIKNGDLKGNALTNAEEQLKQNPDANVFSMDASGTAAGGFSTVSITRGQQASSFDTGANKDSLENINTQKDIATTGAGARTKYLDKSYLAPVANDLNGTYTEGGGSSGFKGQVNRSGLEKLLKNGTINPNSATGQAITQELKNNPGQNTFGFESTWNKNGQASIGVSNNKTGDFTTNGQIGNLITTKIGTDTQNGNFSKKGNYTQNYNNRVANSGGTSTDNHHNNKTSFYGHKFDIPSQYSTSAGYGGLNATPELKPFIDEGLSGKNYNTTTALGAFVGAGVGQFFTNNSGFQNSSANNVKTGLEVGLRATAENPAFGELGGIQGFTQLTQGYSHDIKSATTKDQMLNRTAMYFQGVTHLLAKDKNLTPEQKTAKLNSFTKAFETTTMQNLSPYTSASNIRKRVNALPAATKFKIGKSVYKKDTSGGKAVTETQYLKDLKTGEKNYVKSKEQGAIDNKIKNIVDDRFVK